MRAFTILYWGFAALCSASVLPLQNIHEQLTPSEIRQIFKTTGDDVPHYEITPIHWPRVEKRSADGKTGITLRAFGSDIELWLTTTESFIAGYDTPVYLLRSGASGPQLIKYSNIMEKLEAYEDLKKSAVIVTRRRADNSRALIGTIESENLVIAPIPERLVAEVRRQRRSADDLPESERDDHHYHIVYKKAPQPDNPKHAEPLLAGVRTLQASPSISSTRPETVYPEILVVIDHDLYEVMGKDVWYAAAYTLAFWNAVDLKYRYFENPKFRLNIAGIVLTEDATALEYMPASAYNVNMTKGEAVLKASGIWWYAQNKDIPLDSYDLVVTMTYKSLCSFNRKDSSCYGGVLGMALIAGTCRRHADFQEQSSVAIIMDENAFTGIHTAAHELGHSFGARHDGSKGGCSYADGYIMASTPRLTEKSSEWSACSVRDIDEFLNKNPTCIYNEPRQRHRLPAYLPGKFRNADEQCKMLKEVKACEVNEAICRTLTCIAADRDDNYCRNMGAPAADGTECGDGKVCIIGKCITPPKL